jgi:hypothetical protein
LISDFAFHMWRALSSAKKRGGTPGADLFDADGRDLARLVTRTVHPHVRTESFERFGAIGRRDHTV